MAADLNTLTFGIEIECCMPVDALQANGWTVGGYHNGTAIPGFLGWQAMHDGSIHARYPRTGVEVVSPVLRGIEGLQQARAMVAKLNEMGATVNRSTGFHVHIGWSGDAAALRRLICFVAFHEKALYAVTGTHSREANMYCSSIKLAYRALEQLSSMDQLARAHQSRYRVLNLQNLINGGKRTVEFRVFAGTLNATKIEAYIQLCLGMVQKSLDANAPLAWDAPASKRQAKENIGDGLLAVRRLINHLGWWAHSARKPYGIFDRATLPTIYRKLRELAMKYDGPARVASETTQPTAE